MKKKTVITTESFEVWIIPPSSDAPVGLPQGPEAEGWQPDSTSPSQVPVPEEKPDKGAPPAHED